MGAVSAPPQPSFSQPVGPLRNFLREQELGYVNRALAQTGGDKEKAAEMLGVSVATLYRKLAEGSNFDPRAHFAVEAGHAH